MDREIAELDAIGRAEVARIKAFLTRTTDRFRTVMTSAPNIAARNAFADDQAAPAPPTKATAPGGRQRQ
jgi:Virulence-associated protein E.